MQGFERRYSRTIWVGAALMAVMILATGCENPVRKKVENRIEAALPRLIGPASSYSVRVSGSTMGMLKGKLRTTHIQGRDVRLPSGIMVAELDVVSHGIEIDRHRQQISSVVDTSYRATLAQDALNKYLCDTYRQVPHLKAELIKDQLRLSAAPDVAGVQVRISADAALKVREGRYLILDLKKVAVIGVGTPGFAREYLESRVNPVFDSTNLGYDARVDRVSIRPAGVTIEGTLDLAKQLNVESRLPGDAARLAHSTLNAQLSTSPSP
jgi:hypothetical protein